MNKKIFAIGIISMFLLASVTTLSAMEINEGTKSFNIQISKSTSFLNNGKTLYVGGSGPGNYTKIQDAIDDALNGDIVYVYSGTYYEHVIVDKTITLIGENRDTTIIDGMEDGDVVIISANSVSISGFTIQNSTTLPIGVNRGISVLSSYNTISNNNIGLDYNYYGIYGKNSNYNIISGNKIKDNERGIWLDYSSNNNIFDNQIANECTGISLVYSSNDNIISDNIFNSVYPYSNEDIRLNKNSCNNRILDNTFSSNSGKSIAIYHSSDNNIISGNNILTSSATGIKIADSKDNMIDLNNIKKTGHWGIEIIRCSNCIISNNTITEIKHNYGEGIIIDRCSSTEGNTIYGNFISESHIGIRSYDSENNIISSNNIFDNEIGIELKWWSYYNIISGNNFSDNGIGINNSDGMSHNNIIYHNNFFNSYDQHGLDCGNNIWDDGKYGNYWDDYEEKYPDAHKKWWKGIWDTPYEIPGGNNKDMYPLIKQWSDPNPYNSNQASQRSQNSLQINQQNSNSQSNNVQQSSNPLFFQILQRILNIR